MRDITLEKFQTDFRKQSGDFLENGFDDLDRYHHYGGHFIGGIFSKVTVRASGA
jgi:hypothetical protein